MTTSPKVSGLVCAVSGMLLGAGQFAGACAQTGATPATASGSPAPRCDVACVQASIERAVQSCIPRIEAEAPGDYEWLYRPIGGVFKQADTPETATSTVARFRGDNLRFLNPQNVWVRITYECGFDTAAGRVDYVRVRTGVMGKPSAIPALPPAQASLPPPAGAIQPSAQATQQAAATTSPGSQSDARKVSEPSVVDIRQVSPRTKRVQ